MRAAIVYNTRHESKNPCPLSQLSTLASPPRCSPEPSRCLARRGGQSARATCCCTQGLLDFLQTTLLRHRQATQARATPRTATAFHWRTARTPQAPASALSSPTGWPFPGTYAGRLPRLWQPLATQCPLCQGRAAGGHRQAALAHRTTHQPGILVCSLPETLQGFPAFAHRQGRPGRSRVDHPDRLYEGSLSRFLLDNPYLPP